MIYYLPSSDNNAANFSKKSEIYECCENEEIVKVFKGIRNQLEINESKGMRATQSFSGNHQFSKSLSPMKKSRKPISYF